MTIEINSWQSAFDENRNVFISKLYEEQREAFLQSANSVSTLEGDEIIDVYQDAIVVLYNRLKKGHLELIKDPLRSMLFGIGEKLILKRTTQNTALKTTEAINDPWIQSDDLSLYEKIASDHQKSMITTGMDSLENECRRIIYLYYYHQFSLERIKQEMESSNVEDVIDQKNQCLNNLRASKEGDPLIIENYLLGQLTDTEKETLNERCLSDPKFNALFLQEQDIYRVIETAGNHEMKAALQAMESQHQAKITQMNPKKKLLRLIAGFLFFPLCFFLFKTLSAPSHQDLFNEHYSIYSTELADIKRVSGDSYDLKEAMAEYTDGHYKEAIDGFDHLLAKEQNSEISFYRALALLGDGNATEALSIFNNLQQDDEFRFREALRWYKSLAHIKENEILSAKRELKKITNSDQQFRISTAKEILTILK